MACLSDGIVEVITGTDHILRIELESDDGTAFDLTGTTEMTVAFPSTGPAGSGNLTLADGLSILSPRELGAIIANLSAAFTLQLRVGNKQGFEVKFLKNARTYKVQFKEVLNVIKSSI